MQESCDDSESEIEISDNSDSYFSEESDTEIIVSVAHDKLLGDSVSLGTFKCWLLYWNSISYWIFPEKAEENCSFT